MKLDMQAIRAAKKKHAVPPTDDFSVSVRKAARKARNRYNPDNDPVLQDFKEKMRKIRISS